MKYGMNLLLWCGEVTDASWQLVEYDLSDVADGQIGQGWLFDGEVDWIDGISPAIAIEQRNAVTSGRSTVGTVTEIYDYLRLLYARAGIPRCPDHGTDLEAQTVSQMVDHVLELPAGTKLMLLAPVVSERKGEHVQLMADLQAQGFIRARIDGEIYELDQPPAQLVVAVPGEDEVGVGVHQPGQDRHPGGVEQQAAEEDREGNGVDERHRAEPDRGEGHRRNQQDPRRVAGDHHPAPVPSVHQQAGGGREDDRRQRSHD